MLGLSPACALDLAAFLMAPDPEDTTRVDRGPDPPQRFGPFETVRLLGRGGMGSVYLAEDRIIGRQVAIKEIRIERGVSERRSGRAAGPLRGGAAGRGPALPSRTSPPSTTPSRAMGAYYIALEYVPGTSLDERLKAGPPLAAGRDQARWRRRSRRASTSPTGAASCTATSSRATSCSPRMGWSRSPTSGSPSSSPST